LVAAMPEEESNFCALAVFALPINQLRQRRRVPKCRRQKFVRR
jgi:hypothetical protein